VGDWNGDNHDGVGLYDPTASFFYLTNSFATGYAEIAFGYGEPGQGWKPLVGDWNGDGLTGVALYAPSSSSFYLTDSLTSGYAQNTIGFGEPGANWQPLVGRWASSSGVSSLSSVDESTVNAKAVDQLDLSAVAAEELASDAGLDEFVAYGPQKPTTSSSYAEEVDRAIDSL
jgi:hypothetical protein